MYAQKLYRYVNNNHVDDMIVAAGDITSWCFGDE